MNIKTDQTAYIKYLEERLEKLSENSSIGDQDLNTLVDTQNEIIINNSYSFKKALTENERSLAQIDELQKRNDMSDLFIQYLMDSFWWKATRPFRFISRQFKNLLPYPPFDFSQIKEIQSRIDIFIYATDANNSLSKQIENLRSQIGFTNLKITIVDLTSSNDIAKIAKSTKANYINLAATDNDIALSKGLASDSKYTIYISQGICPNDSNWLYKMVRPLIDKYALASALYDPKTSQITRIKTETFFKELKSRIIPIGRYECMYLPLDRNGIQYIPPMIMNDVSAIAKIRK